METGNLFNIENGGIAENDENAEKDGMLQLCIDIWNDYRSGAVDYKSLAMETYTRKYHVSKFPKTFVIPILLQSEKPTMEDAKRLRTEINSYRNYQRSPQRYMAELGSSGENKGKDKNNFGSVAAAISMTEEMAIAVLKQKGYRVMKKTTAYIDL